jgi:hypothetical protein
MKRGIIYTRRREKRCQNHFPSKTKNVSKTERTETNEHNQNTGSLANNEYTLMIND